MIPFHITVLTSSPEKFPHQYQLTPHFKTVRLRPRQPPLQTPPQRPALHGAHLPKRRPDPPLSRLRQRLLRLHRRRIPPHGPQGHRLVLWQRLHLGVVGTELRATRARQQ